MFQYKQRLLVYNKPQNAWLWLQHGDLWEKYFLHDFNSTVSFGQEIAILGGVQ